MQPPPAPPPVLSLADPASFKSQMESAGFDDVEVDFVSRDLEVAGFDTMWGMLTSGAPAAQMLFDRVGPGGKNKLRDTLAGITEKRFGAGPLPLRLRCRSAEAPPPPSVTSSFAQSSPAPA